MEDPKVRKPRVAGQFYPSSPQRLKTEIEALLGENATKRDVIACIMPHAGYIYSGKVAAKVASSINIKGKVILLGPNHTGYGKDFGIMSEGVWQTPLGEVPVEGGLANALLKNSAHLEEDSLSHAYEHSLEVELPFLQYCKPGFAIVPITFAPSDLKTCKEIGAEIADTVKELGIKEDVLIVASSDMTHYETQKSAEKKDNRAIKAILDLDEDKLWEEIHKFNISMCGYAPAIAMLRGAKLLGADKAELLDYQTSADATGDYASVVGYAGIIIY